MPRWLARLAHTLVLMSCLGWQPAEALGTALCDGLLLLDRLPGEARRLLDDRAPASERAAYLAAIERASLRFDPGSPDALPSDLAAGVRQIVWLHRRFLDLTDAGNIASASHLIESSDWHRIEAWLGDQLRLADCDASARSGGPDIAPAGVAAPHPPNRVAHSPRRQTDPASQRLQTPAIPAQGPLVLLFAIAAVVVAAFLLHRRRDQRDCVRVNCFISGALQGHLYCEATEILDISRKGCKLRLHDRLAPERPLTLFLGERKVPARTVWSNRHYAGVRFDNALTATELRDILDRSALPPGGGPPVPALPCHDANCRAQCENYMRIRLQKSRSGDAAAGHAGTTT